jgi:putative membrane protein
MRVTRRLVSLLALATLVALPASLPALAQSGTAERVTHRQSILTEMSPEGEAKAARVFTQLTVVGDGEVELALPNQSTSGLRNLEGFGRPRVDGDQVVYSVAASRDGAAERTVADHTADLPIEISIAYELDGEPIEPRDLVGKTGDLTATFTVRNTTAVPTEVQFFDGRQNPQRETIDVAVPMVGSLSMNLDRRFVDIDAPAASVAGDGRGNTTISWSMVLFEPVGSEEQTVSYTAHVTDAIVPEMIGQFLPVDSSSFSSLKSVQDTFGDVADGLSSLTTGALIVDGNVKLLADGAGQLLDGLGQLSDGADQLSAGLNERAAPGSRQLADGMGQARAGGRQLADGLLELESGAGQLSAGLGQARAGSGELATGLGDLRDGAGELSAGLGQVRTGSGDLATGLGDLATGGDQLATGAGELAAGSGDLAAGLGEVAVGTEKFPAAAEGLESIAAGITGIKNGIGDRDNPTTIIGALSALRNKLGEETDGPRDGTLRGGLNGVALGISNPDCVLTDPGDPENPCGLLQVFSLVKQVNQGAAAALDTECDFTDENLDPADCGGKQLAGAAAGQAESAKVTAGILAATLAALAEGDPTLAPLAVDAQTAAVAAGTAEALAGGAEQKAGGAATALQTQAVPLIDAATNGITRVDEARPGLLQAVSLLGGGVTNPACDPRNPLDPENPCGAREVLGLVLGGLDNPTCDLRDPAGEKTGNPCGVKQVLELLQPGANQLATELAPGLLALSAAFGTLEEPGALLAGGLAVAGGADAVADGAGKLAAGAGRAELGSLALNSGLIQLDDGGQRLAAGAGRAASGAGDLRSGLVQLDDGGQQLAAGSRRAADGSNDLANGLVQLDDGANELASGLGDAADGSVQLAEGLESAEEGGEKIADGTQALTDRGMSQIIDGASDGAMTPARAVAHAKAADARGKAGDGLPYGTVAGAEASAVYKFEIAGYGGPDEGPSTPVRAAATLAAFGIAGALGLGLRRTLV